MKLLILIVLFNILSIVFGEFITLTALYTVAATATGYGIGSYFDFIPSRCNSQTWFFNKNRLYDNFNDKIVGQHIAKEYLYRAVVAHTRVPEPKQALSLVLSGFTGTGKNLASQIIGESYFQSDSSNVHIFAGRQVFTEESKIREYREKLVEWVKEKVKQCPWSIFIFDEIDKIPANILDVLNPFLDFNSNVHGVDYRKATFLFLTNHGGLEINSNYQQLLRSGVDRNAMTYKDFESVLKRALFKDGMLKNAGAISSDLISGYVPFLPLELEHVRKCIYNEFMNVGKKTPLEEDVAGIIESIEFRENQYSLTGCKRVRHLVAVELARD